MSFTTWTFDPDIQLNDWELQTKPQSYAFGRRLYTFKINQQKYWLKYHVPNMQVVLAQAFQHEIDFYHEYSSVDQGLLLPHQIIQLEQFPQFAAIAEARVGLLLMDTEKHFSDITTMDRMLIQQKMMDALNTLDRLHQLGWIHGDLKPEHFRVYQKNCYLIDFEQSCKEHSQIKNMNATPHYMAPELFHGQPKSMQSDLYALGIILYEWLTQTRLSAMSYQDWAVLHCQQLQIHLPQQFEYFRPLFNGLLRKQIDQRFRDVWAVKNSLKHLNLL